VRIRAVAALVLASSLGIPPRIQGQQRSATELPLSFASGSVFEGAAFGLAYAPPQRSALSFGATDFDAYGASGGHGTYGGYGIYDDGYWGSRYFGSAAPHWRGYRCADVWSVLDGPYYGAFDAGFYDDWFYFSGLYYDCVLKGPSWVYHRYHSFRPFFHGHRRFRPFRPKIVISIAIFDPFRLYWGPFHAYDPWGHYWTNWVVFSGHGPRVRPVFVRPGPIYRRPSPIYVAGTTFKEDPRGGAQGVPGRTAQPRPSSAPVASAPAPGRNGPGIQAPPRRTAASGSGAAGATTRPPSSGGSAAPRRGGAGERPSSPVAPGPSGNAPRTTDPDRRGPLVSPGPSSLDAGGSPERSGATRPAAPATGGEPTRRDTPPVQAQPPRTGSSRGGGNEGGGSPPSTPSSVNRPSSRFREDAEALPRVVTPEDRPPSTLPRVIRGNEPQSGLPQLVAPRSSNPPGPSSAAQETRPEHLSGPPPEPRPREEAPSTRATEPSGERPSYPVGPTQRRPSDAAAPQGQPTQRQGWTTSPRTQTERGSAGGRQPQTSPAGRSAPGAREAPPQSPQAAPQTRPAAPETRQSAPPQTRQASPQTRQAPPQTRQAPPQTRQDSPQTRQAPPQTRQAPPQARQAPSRPSAPPSARPAPQGSGGGSARPLPAPRRPPGDA
jgi:hypothetical protein